MVRLWDRYWNCIGQLPDPDVWPVDCLPIDDAWRWQGVVHVTLHVGGRCWSGRVLVSDGCTFARYVDVDGIV